MSRKQQEILGAIRDLCPRGSRLLLAVSGGVDSMCLLHACYLLKDEMNISLEVAHVDHGLRKNSKADGDFVGEACAQLSIPFHLKRLSPPKLKENIEAWGRKERYRFFKVIRKERDLDFVLTAHNANDVAETLLMRLIANKELNSIKASDPERKLLRPFLNIAREAIEDFVNREGILFREDETNVNLSFLRNKIRHHLIPFLQNEFDPRIVETLSLRAKALEDDTTSINESLKSPVLEIAKHEFGSKEWRREFQHQVKCLPQGIAWRLASLVIKEKLGYNLGRAHSKKLLQFLLGESQGVELPGGVRLKSHAGGTITSH